MEARFSGDANFNSASFSADADFYGIKFSVDASFNIATFKDYVHFGCNSRSEAFVDQTQLTFYSSRFEKPDRVSYHTLDLKPNGFVNVDSRKFEFTDVEFKCKLSATVHDFSRKSCTVAESLQPNHINEFGPYRLDATERHLWRDGKTVPLQPKVFDLLLVLVERRVRLVEKGVSSVGRRTFEK